MTEAEWPNCSNIGKLVDFLRNRTSTRKWRLFAHACCARLHHLCTDEFMKWSLSAIEMHADGQYRDQDLADLYDQVGAWGNNIEAPLRDREGVLHASTLSTVANAMLMAVKPEFTWSFLSGRRISTIGSLVYYAQSAIAGLAWEQTQNQEKTDAAKHAEALFQASLIKELFGSSFPPPSVSPSWRTYDVRALAEAIYEERAFDRMPILADALQEAGCNNDAILTHCRSDGPHVRGCWVVDLVLGKE
jgi:hypothetical protein